MTAIAGVADGRRVWIGGDSAATGGQSLVQRADEKVFVKGPMVFGFAGSFRMGQVLRFALEIPTRNPNIGVEEWLATEFVDMVRWVMKEGGSARKSKGREALDGQFLVGYEGRLFNIDGDYQVGESASGYDAAGSGSDVVLGALCVATGSPGVRIRRALEAAEKFNAAVRGPFTIKSGGAVR